MKALTILISLILILGCIGISGCVDSSNDNTTNANTKTAANEYTVGTSTFQMPDGWIKSDKYTGDLAKFTTGKGENDGATLYVKKFSDINEQDSEYKEFSRSGYGYTVTTITKTVSGIQTKVIKRVYDDPQSIKIDYYFQKNGKYYRITTEVFSKDVDNSLTDEALNKVISTLN
ncbi:MAG: hypothetical protein QME14_04615 [Methanobacteriaceae archaeon]|nr:hypothetical protein [Methanobacteriaceae archaeon]